MLWKPAEMWTPFSGAFTRRSQSCNLGLVPLSWLRRFFNPQATDSAGWIPWQHTQLAHCTAFPLIRPKQAQTKLLHILAAGAYCADRSTRSRTWDKFLRSGELMFL